MNQLYELNSEMKLELIKPIETLKKGMVLHWGGNMGYIAQDLVIIEVVKNDFGTKYLSINLKRNGETEQEYIPYIHHINSHSVKKENDPKSWHSQHHFITEKTLLDEEINKLKALIPIVVERERVKEANRIKAIKESGNLTKSEKISLGTKEISRLIREKLKTKFPNCKFSVTKTGGHSNINISLIESDFKVFRTYEELSELAVLRYKDDGRRTEEQLKSMCEDKYAQLNQYSSNDDYNKDVWNNGHFLTEQAHNLFKEVVKIADYYNYDESDSQTDYFNTNFYLHLEIGRDSERPLKIVKKGTKKKSESILVKEITFKLNEEKQGLEIYFPSKPSEEIRNTLKNNGFRWGKYNKCWYKKNSKGLLETIKKDLGVDLNE